jgi:hypothetical protein
MKRKWKTILLGAFFLQAAFSSSCVWVYQAVREYSGPMLIQTPEELFRLVIEDPIPKSVRYLQAAGDCWDGFSVYFRFAASDVFLSSYTASWFASAPCYLIEHNMALPSHEYDIFQPEWDPDKGFHYRCFKSHGEIGVQWIGTQYLQVNDDNEWIYIHASGDAHVCFESG